jgi:hypothetical protein
MKRLLPLLLVASAALAQSPGFQYRDAAGNLSVQATDGRAERTVGGFKFVLRGRVVTSERDQGLELRADQLEVDAVSAAKETRIRDAVATGSVRMTKAVTTSNGEQVTIIDGSRANYRADASKPTVQVAGPVTVVSRRSARRETMRATGGRGVAVLDPGTKGRGPSGIQRAELTGSVVLNVEAVEPDGSVSKLKATGGRLIVDEREQPTVTILDNVQMDGQGAYGFRLRNMRRVVMKLNDQGQVTSFMSERGG